MIKIKEDVSTKLCGGTSLYVSFTFNKEIVETLKQCTTYEYNSKNYTWEVSIDNLQFLLDELCYLDDIELSLKPEEKRIYTYYPRLKENYKIPAFNHQIEGITYGLNNDKWLLLDEPGLGKTAQIIHLCEELQLQKGVKHCLIVCAINSLKANWEMEIKKHSNLSCRMLGRQISKRGKVSYKTISGRRDELLQPIDEFFIVTNIETLRDDSVITALNKNVNGIDMIVIDECHKIKNSQSVQGKNLLKLKDFQYKVGLTGTPIVSSPIDAYSMLVWVGAERKDNLTRFKGLYGVYNQDKQLVGYRNLDLLNHHLDRVGLRRKKDIIKDLPPKIIIPETLEMDSKQKQFYENIEDGVFTDLDLVNMESNQLLALNIRLRQAASCPEALTTEKVGNIKIDRAVELTEEIVFSGDKVVIVSNFKEPLRQLYPLLKDYNPLLGTGDVDQETFKNNVYLFQNDNKYKVFLATTQKSGTGITLNAAHYMICLDMPWTYSDQKQVEDRIHRVDNDGTAFIYRLCCKDTIDEAVQEAVEFRKALSDNLVDSDFSENTTNLIKNYFQKKSRERK